MMKYIYTAIAAVTFTAIPGLAMAIDGSRQPAGGAHMSSYVNDPYHDPRSLHSQRRGNGQILGQPMLSENAGFRDRRTPVSPHWASGRSGRHSR